MFSAFFWSYTLLQIPGADAAVLRLSLLSAAVSVVAVLATRPSGACSE